MREIGEQWIENGRMYKVVLPGLCDGCDFNMGCLQNGGVNCKAGHCVTKQGHVKDLGPVNNIGLPLCPFCKGYPELESEENWEGKDIWFVECDECGARTAEYFEAEEARSAWERRT